MITIVCKTEAIAKRMRDYMSEFGNSVECLSLNDAPDTPAHLVITKSDLEWFLDAEEKEFVGSTYLTNFRRSILCKHKV